MKNFKSLFILFLGLGLATSSCKKTDDTTTDDNNNNNSTSNTCYVNKMDYGDSYSVIHYDANHLITELVDYDSLGNPENTKTTFTYNGTKLTKMESIDNGNVDTRIVFIYSNSENPDSVVMYSQNNGSLERAMTLALSFSNNKISSVSGYYTYMGQTINISRNDYTWNGENVSEVKEYEMGGTMQLEYSGKWTYTYDDKNSPYKNLGLQNLIIMEDVSFLSTNNPLTETYTDNTGIIDQSSSLYFTYEYTTENYPSKVTESAVDNSYTDVTMLTYDCQ